MSIPTSWKISTPVNSGCTSLVARSNGELLLVKPKVFFALPCPFILPTAAAATHDAAVLYLTSHNPNAPRPTGSPLTAVRNGSTTVRVYVETGDPNALDLLVRRAGSDITHTVTLGLGRDGRTAAAVLSSIHATT